MPPPAPSTATFVCRAELVEKARDWVDKRRAAERDNMEGVKGSDVGRWQKSNCRLSRCVGVEPERNFPTHRAELPIPIHQHQDRHTIVLHSPPLVRPLATSGSAPLGVLFI
jgi:hypothetical protein